MAPTDGPERRRPRGGSIRDAARNAAGGAGRPEQERPEADAPGLWASAPPDAPPPAGFDAQRTLGEWLEGLVPPEAQLHFLNAGREFAAGLQVTLDHHLGRHAEAPATNRPIRIEIE